MVFYIGCPKIGRIVFWFPEEEKMKIKKEITRVSEILPRSARVDEKPPDNEEDSGEAEVEADHHPGRLIPLHVGAVAFEADVKGCRAVDEKLGS